MLWYALRNMKSKRHIYAVAALAFVGFLSLLFVHSEKESRVSDTFPNEFTIVATKTEQITYEAVLTEEKRVKGLSGRESVPINYGMLFVFSEPSLYGFWMKDMLVPIDILWLSDTGVILQIDSQVKPETYPKVFYPSVPVSLVLEMAGGEANRKGFAVGTTLSLPKTK